MRGCSRWATGTYTLLVEGSRIDTGVGSYTLNVQPVSDEAFGLTVGATVSEAIDEQGEQDVYSFTLGAPARLYFDSLTGSGGSDGNFRWALQGPAGVVATNQAFSSSEGLIGSGLAEDPRRLQPAGAYTLTVSGAGATTGAYSFRLLDLAAATPLTPGTPVSGTLDPANETDPYWFEAQAGTGSSSTRWRGAGRETRGGGCSTLQQPVFDLGFSSASSDAGLFTLGATGTYTLLVEGSRIDTGVGSYTLNVQPVSDEAFGLTVGATVSEAIDEQGEQDVYSFTLGAPARLYFDSLTGLGGNDGNFRWGLQGPAGVVATNQAFSSAEGLIGSGLAEDPRRLQPAGRTR